MISFFKRPLGIVTAVIIVLIAAGIVSALVRAPKSNFQTAEAKLGEIRQEVSVTGTVKPSESLDLAFQASGKIRKMNVDVGDTVAAGQVLAQLDSADVNAQLAQNQAALESQRADLLALQRGSRPEEIQIQRSALEKAQQDLTNYYDGTIDTLADAYNKADDSVRTKTSAIVIQYTSTNFSLSFNSCDSQAQIDAEHMRVTSEEALVAWQQELAGLSVNSSQAQKDLALMHAVDYLTQFKAFLDRVNDTLVGGCTLTATTLDTYRTSLNTARTNIVSALSAVSDLRQAIAAQKITVQKTKDELDLDLAGSTAEQIAAQEALVKQAEANVMSAQARLAQTSIVAPISGTVTVKNAEVGEIVAANATVLSMISNSKMEIKADVPEVDVAKIQVGDTAQVTLDAYGNDMEFPATVTKIDPAETVISGVIYYRTTLVFGNEDERLKPGMTANVVILTEKKENAISVPQRAVITDNGKVFVRVVNPADPTKYEEREVKTGITGSEGEIEIVSGLNAGEVVVTYLNSNGQ